MKVTLIAPNNRCIFYAYFQFSLEPIGANFNWKHGEIMNVQIGISILCGLVGLLIGILTFSRNRDRDVKDEASKSAVIETKLDSINRGVETIQIDMKANEKRLSELSERVIRVEESSKQAHKRIDSLENKGDI
jgi:septal ring factor EnvC (AmiA/AmiB activator)